MILKIIRLVVSVFMLLLLILPVFAEGRVEKPRVIVLTDIENEPDDAQSLVRFLSYSNQFDVEGIIATTSVWLRDKTAEWRIHEILEAYKEVQANLSLHEPGYPTYEALKALTKVGLPIYGMKGVGEGQESAEEYPSRDHFRQAFHRKGHGRGSCL